MTPTTINENKPMTVARAFGLSGDGWMRHANPASVWTRFAGLPLLVLAIWSRDWIGGWAVVPVGVAVLWLIVNPLFFRPPRSTRNWASRSVLGERIWTEADHASLPAQFTNRTTVVAQLVQVVGLAIMTYGLVVLDPVATVSGLLLTQVAKVWYLDRMVLLFEDMRGRNAEYAAWDRSP